MLSEISEKILGIVKKIDRPIALTCDLSFAMAIDEADRPVFPKCLVEDLSKKFKFSVLGELDALPVVFIRAARKDVRAMDTYLESVFGDKVTLDCGGTVVTDISSAPTLP